jgi:zinc transport system substrate-binding protein
MSVCLVLLLSGCFSTPAVERQAPAKPVVAVAIVPQEAWVKAVAGDLVDVVTMIPPGKSAETYAPTPQQMTQFSKASLYFSIQAPAETASILPKVKDLNSQVRIVDLAAAAKAVYSELHLEEDSHDHGHSHSEGERDPHIWLSPKRAIVMVQAIAAELAAFDPPNKAVYEKNAQEYIAKIRQLDESIHNLLKDNHNKTFVIYHPSLGYFAKDYGLNMLALESHGKDATPQELQKAIELARQQNIKAILYQEEMDSRQAKTFAAEIGGVTLKFTPLASDYLGNLEQIARVIAKGAN